MKTIMDAVNATKGDTSKLFQGWLFIGLDQFCAQDVADLVNELSNATWIKGASLAEYQAADKEVLKVENKTIEVDGELYQLEKDYEFATIKRIGLDTSCLMQELGNINS